MSESKPTPGDHIVCTEFDGGEGILVDLSTKRYYQLNETALLIWKGLEKGQELDAIVAQVTAEYEVSADHARSSVVNLINRLSSNKLL